MPTTFPGVATDAPSSHVRDCAANLQDDCRPRILRASFSSMAAVCGAAAALTLVVATHEGGRASPAAAGAPSATSADAPGRALLHGGPGEIVSGVAHSATSHRGIEPGGVPAQAGEVRAFLPRVVRNTQIVMRPALLATLHGGESRAMGRLGDIAVWNIGEWLATVDMSQPAAPRMMGTVRTGTVRSVTAQGHLVYLATDAGLSIVDIGVPSAPRVLGSLPGSPYDVAVDGHYAFIGAVREGLIVADVSDPGAPRRVAGVDLPTAAGALEVADGYVYVAGAVDSSTALHVVDVRDPATPTLVASLAVAAYDVDVVEGYAYVAGDGLLIADVHDPASPRVVGRVPRPARSESRSYRVVVDGTHAYVASSGDDGALEVVDVARPDDPQLIEAATYHGAFDSTVALCAERGVAWIAGRTIGLRVVDFTDVARPRELGRLETPVAAVGVAAAGGTAWLADRNFGLRVIDARLPVQSRIVASLEIPGSPYVSAVAVSGTTAYMLMSEGVGDNLVAVAEPTAPREIGRIAVPGGSTLSIADGYAYVTCDSRGSWLVRVVDVRDPTRPTNVTQLARWPRMRDIFVHGRYGYVADPSVTPMTAALRVVDLSDMSAPVEVASVRLPGSPVRVTVEGGYAYVVTAEAGLRIVDVRDPGAPREAAAVTVPGVSRYNDVVVAGGLAFIGVISDTPAGGYFGTVWTTDVTDPTNPGPAHAVDGLVGWYVDDLAADGNLVYVAAGPDVFVVGPAR